jgi:lipopolysaccharide transport system ATP-binding protein
VAFALATVRRPDLLIVDEALSVGDAYFQHKSFNKIREFQKQGTSLLLVSHDRAAIQSVCDRAILLEDGCLTRDGKPDEVFDYYNAIIAQKGSESIEENDANGRKQIRSGSGEAHVRNITLLDSEGKVAEVIRVGEAVSIKMEILVDEPISQLVLGFCIKDRLGQTIFGTNTWFTEQVMYDVKRDQGYEIQVKFTADLGRGSYSISTALHDQENHLSANYEWQDLAFVFKVVNVGHSTFEGSCWLDPSIEISEL